MLHRIIGRAGSGKSALCRRIIARCVEEKRKVFLIVPEQRAVISEREMIGVFGNLSNLYVEVINFKRLCNRVFRETGGLIYRGLDSAGRKLVLARTLDTITPALAEYTDGTDNPLFINRIYSQINEFISYGITPAALERAMTILEKNPKDTLFKKLGDLSLIYSSFHACLREDFGDGGDPLDKLSETLRENAFFHGSTVIIDSFFGFTPQEFKIIEQILLQADHTYITFLASADGADELFPRGEQAKRRILLFAKDRAIAYEDILLRENNKYKKDSGLFRLENAFSVKSLAFAQKDDRPCEDVRIIGCETPLEEARCACAIISRLLSAGRVRCRDIAICMRDPSLYEGIIDALLEKNDIPYHFSRREELLSQPLVTLLLSAFDIYPSWRLVHVLRYMKTGLSGLTDQEADLLETYAVTWDISGSRWKADQWVMHPDGYTAEFSDRAKGILEVVNRARGTLLSALEPFCEDLKDADNAKEISKAAFRLLREVRLSNQEEIESEQNAVFWNHILDALDKMALVAGDMRITPKKYAELLRLILEEYDTGRIPSSIEEVQIASCEFMRTDNVTHIIILGANEGVFPAGIAPDGIFSDREKRLLLECGIAVSPDGVQQVYDELFLAYHSLCAAREKAYVLYSKRGLRGEEKQPSALISMIKNILPRCEEIHFPFGDPLENLTGSQSAAEQIAAEQDAEMRAALELYIAGREEYAPLTQKTEQARKEPEYLSGDALSLVSGDRLYASASRLEQFNLCAFSYFGKYLLGVRSPRQAELGALETGNIAHKALELFLLDLSARKSEQAGLPSAEEAEQIIQSILTEHIRAITGGEKSGGKRFEYLYARLSRMLRALARSLVTEMAQSDFIPRDFELDISAGTQNGVPAHPIEIEDNGQKIGELYLSGKVDRVDTFEKDGQVYVRVIDYKTGSKKFRREDIEAGINLQMLLYLFHIWKNGKDRYRGEIIPAGVLYLPCHRPESAVSLGEDEGTALAKTEGSFTANGVVLDDLNVLKAMEKDLQSRFIPAELKKDGGLSKKSSIASIAEMGEMINGAARVASRLGREMKKGNIKINPYRCEINSCNYCDLLPLCRYERGKSETRWRMESVQ